MSKLSLQNPSIHIVASKKLRNFIQNLKDEKSMPENLLEVYLRLNNNKSVDGLSKTNVIPISDPYTKSEIEFLKRLNKYFDAQNFPMLDSICSSTENNDENSKNEMEIKLNLTDIKWLNNCLKEKRQKDNQFKIYLHELIDDSTLQLPVNDIQKRDPILEERCQKLRQQQETFIYNKITKNVDGFRKKLPEDTISFQIKQINRQLIAVAQFIFSVAAGFAFGFIGVELIVGNLDFGFRLLLGIMCSLVIAIAEIYFLAKKLTEEDSFIEDIKESTSGTSNNKKGKFKFD